MDLSTNEEQVEKAGFMSSQTLLGRATAKLAGLLTWLKDFAPTRRHHLDETSELLTFDDLMTYVEPNEFLPIDCQDFERVVNGYYFIPTTPKASLNASEETQWADNLRSKYGIAKPQETE